MACFPAPAPAPAPVFVPAPAPAPAPTYFPTRAPVHVPALTPASHPAHIPDTALSIVPSSSFPCAPPVSISAPVSCFCFCSLLLLLLPLLLLCPSLAIPITGPIFSLQACFEDELLPNTSRKDSDSEFNRMCKAVDQKT